MKYKVGDKVRIKDRLCKENRGLVGIADKWLGKVVTIKYYIGAGYYGIEEDREDNDGYGWGWHENSLEPDTTQQKIIITTDGKTTTARLYNSKTLEKETVAKCHPDDEFDFKKGADYAFKRLFNTYYTGKVVCSKAWSGPWTVGKIYPVVDGIIHNDNGQAIDEIKSVDDLNREFLSVKFIELVEG